jgi:hypothetical protein
MQQSEAWRAAFEDLRGRFREYASKGSNLPFVIVAPQGETQGIPSPLTAEVNAAQACVRFDPWTPPWAHEPATARLYGPKPEIKAFRQLAEEAWTAIPGTPDGKAPLSHHTDPAWRWLDFLCAQLQWEQISLHGNFFEPFDQLWVTVRGKRGKNELRKYLPEEEPKDEQVPGATGRWRVTALSNPFSASAQLLGLRLMDREQCLYLSGAHFKESLKQSVESGDLTLDFIQDAKGRWLFDVTGNACTIVAGAIPTVCPQANPPIDSVYLPLVEQVYREFHLIAAGQTIHWVGRPNPARACKCFTPQPTVTGETTPPKNSMTLAGKVWTIMHGAELGRYQDRKDSFLRHLARLLAEPNRKLAPQDFFPPPPGAAPLPPMGHDEAVGPEGLTDLESRMTYLANEIKDASAAQDTESAARLRDELDRLTPRAIAYEKARRGGHKISCGTLAPDEKADQNLTVNLNELITRLRNSGMPKLADHLTSSIIHKSQTWMYAPPTDTPPWCISHPEQHAKNSK